MPVTVGILPGDGVVGSLGIYDKVILGKELVGHLNGGSKISSGIAAQVNYEFLHAFAAQIGQAGEHFGECGLTELVDHDITDALLG